MSDRKPISYSKAIRGLKWFIGLSIFGLLLNFTLNFYTDYAESYRYLTQFKFAFLVIALGLNLLDWVLGGLRIMALSAPIYSRPKLKTSLESNLGNIFLGAVTPSQTGGGAAQIYVLYKNGMPFAEATVSSIVCFICSMIFLIFCGLYISFFGNFPNINASFLIFSKVTIILFSAIILLFGLAVIKPQIFERVAMGILSRIPILKRLIKSDNSKLKLQAFFNSVNRYQDILKIYISKGKLSLLAGLIISSAIYLNKFFIAYIVLKGMSLEVPFVQTIVIQMILFLIFYFAPTPGASGIAEFSSAQLIGLIIPRSSQAVFTMFWRAFTLYIGVVIGGMIMIRYILEKGEKGD